MSWWLRRLLDFLSWLAARITSRRYEVLARQIGRSPAEVTGLPPARRFVVIQIDGLSFDHLQQAMALGYTPTLQRLIGQGYRLQPWCCGVPSSTPSVQAGLMYGDNWDIPAFRWYEKAEGLALTCRNPAHVERIKARIAPERRGILAGGSSYGNMFDGDARLALFTLSAMGRQRFFEHLRGLGWALLFILNPWSTLRTIALAVWELLRDIGHSAAQWARLRFRRRPVLVRPFFRTLVNIVFGQIQAFGVLVDVYRGMPAIWVNFYGYDEVAHEDGPLGREALRALRRIDSHIRQINRVRRTYQPDMDLYILSDHGMTPCTPFQALTGQTLPQFIAQYARTPVASNEEPGLRKPPGQAQRRPSDPDNASELAFFLDELDGIEPHLSRRGQRLVQALRRWIAERKPPDPEAGWDFARGHDIVVRVSGSMAHLYFNVSRQRMDVSEIAILYPELVDALNDHPAIGLVLGTEGGRPVMVTSRGTAALSAERLPPGLVDPERTAGELLHLLSFPHSGDLVLLGAWHEHGRHVVTFEDQVATHGGIGGPQEFPFVLTPPDAPLELSRISNARQLYPYFLRRYHGEQPLGPVARHQVTPELPSAPS